MYICYRSNQRSQSEQAPVWKKEHETRAVNIHRNSHQQFCVCFLLRSSKVRFYGLTCAFYGWLAKMAKSLNTVRTTGSVKSSTVRRQAEVLWAARQRDSSHGETLFCPPWQGRQRGESARVSKHAKNWEGQLASMHHAYVFCHKPWVYCCATAMDRIVTSIILNTCYWLPLTSCICPLCFLCGTLQEKKL